MKYLIGRKSHMSRIFTDSGMATPVTVVTSGPNVVTQIKSAKRDGVDSVQVGFDETKKKLGKSKAGHLKGLPSVSVMRDVRLDEGQSLNRGDTWSVSVFEMGDKVSVTGTSKGKGFQGVVRRHGFHGSPKTHGHKDQLRMPGSIATNPQGPVAKGKKMPGRMGNQRTTLHNIEVVQVDEEKNLLFLKGAIPGARGTLIEIRGVGEMNIASEKEVDPKADQAATGESQSEQKEEVKESQETLVEETK